MAEAAATKTTETKSLESNLEIDHILGHRVSRSGILRIHMEIRGGKKGRRAGRSFIIPQHIHLFSDTASRKFI